MPKGLSNLTGRSARFKDRTGQRFGMLTILSLFEVRKHPPNPKSKRPKDYRSRPFWRVKCDCGKETIVGSQILYGRYTPSCGCLTKLLHSGKKHWRFKDLTGKVFGELVVLEYAGSIPGKNKMGKSCTYNIWLCKCSCGTLKKIRGTSITRGLTKSCGHLSHLPGSSSPHWRGTESIPGQYFSSLVSKATERNLEVSITTKDIEDVWETQNRRCALTGLPIGWGDVTKTKDEGRGEKMASVDRINNSLGYIKSNIQILHLHINLMKLTHQQSYFTSLCKAVVDYNSNK